MRKLIYSMTMSLDGYIAGPGGAIDWSAPSEELHRFHNQQSSEIGAELLGRRLYETMLFWETDDNVSGPVAVEFAQIWRAIPKIVFSTTLTTVVGNARLARGEVADEVARLKAQPGLDIAIGGAGLGASAIRLGLVDEFRVFTRPVVLGEGTPFFPALEQRIQLEAVERRWFEPGVSYVRYRVLPSPD
jgi:dihydrofolate reductase